MFGVHPRKAWCMLYKMMAPFEMEFINTIFSIVPSSWCALVLLCFFVHVKASLFLCSCFKRRRRAHQDRFLPARFGHSFHQHCQIHCDLRSQNVPQSRSCRRCSESVLFEAAVSLPTCATSACGITARGSSSFISSIVAERSLLCGASWLCFKLSFSFSLC